VNGNQIHAVNNGNSVGAYAYSLFGNQTSFTTSDHVHTYYTYRPDGLRHSIDDKMFAAERPQGGMATGHRS
jgi:hypothetical protein